MGVRFMVQKEVEGPSALGVLQGRAKEMELTFVREVQSWPIGCASAALG